MDPVKFGFQQAGRLELRDHQLQWTPTIEFNGPCIYCWLLGETIVYVGKAGYGLSKRMNEHCSGFRQADAASKKKLQIIEDLQGEGACYTVYALKSNPVMHNCFGVSVTTYSWDEHAFYARCKRDGLRLPLNLGGFPAAEVVEVGKVNALISPEDEDAPSSVDEILEYNITENKRGIEPLVTKLNKLAHQHGIDASNKWVSVACYTGMKTDEINAPKGLGTCTWSVCGPLCGNGKVKKNSWIFRIPNIGAADAENWILVPREAVTESCHEKPKPANSCGFYLSFSDLVQCVNWEKLKSRVEGQQTRP